MFPKNNSLRKKNIIVNSKKVTISPWTNITLSQYENIHSITKYRIDLVLEHLITPFIETKAKLTILDEQIILYELYMLSKGNQLDIQYTCSECESKGIQYTLALDKIILIQELKKQIIKTTDYTFNLNKFSNYRLDLTKDTNIESLKYICSFIESFSFKDKNYVVEGLDELIEYLNVELPQKDFKILINSFNDIQPKININAEVTCAQCGHIQKIDFQLQDFLV